jgi:HEPN domain-containing protein
LDGEGTERPAVHRQQLASERVPWDAVCYHAQQAAEKALKAVLAFRDADIPRTHDLLALLAACSSAGCPLDHSRADADLLNPFSTAARYPGLAPDPDASLGKEVVAASRRVVAHVEKVIAG